MLLKERKGKSEKLACMAICCSGNICKLLFSFLRIAS